MVLMTHAHARLLVLVRHAKAEKGEDGDDHDRRLTAVGTEAAEQAGRWLADVLPGAVDTVWVSSASRALATWDGIAPALKAPPADVDRGLYQAGHKEVLARVTASEEPVLVVVGHNPTVEEVLAALLASSPAKPRGMRPGAVAVVDLDSRALLDFWEPRRASRADA